MLAPVLLLGLVLGYETCDKVPSCTLQVNGTRPKSAIISTLPNGGAGYAFTATDCIRGLIGITEPCQCRNSTMWAAGHMPGFCYFSGNYSQPESIDHMAFCKNQNGENTFSILNATQHAMCSCFDPTTGMKELASVFEPYCKNGKSAYTPCSTDGKNDNAALLAEFPKAKKDDITRIFGQHIPHYALYQKCQCGRSTCFAPPGNSAGPQKNRYCHSEIEYCSDAPACDVDKVFEPKDLYQQKCQCGFLTCGHGEKCQTKVVDGFKKYVCTYKGRSFNAHLLIKTFGGQMFMAFVFGLVALVCLICVVLFWILSCMKITAAAKVGSTNIQSQ